MKTIIAKGSHILGKLSRNCDKTAPRNCEARLTWELRDDAGKLEFSAQGEVWNHLRSDTIMGGQCVDELAALFPRDKLAQRIAQTWRAYHLNDMNAGTPEQSAALAAGEKRITEQMRREGDAAILFYSDGKPNWYAIAKHMGYASGSHYDIACAILKEAGLYDVPVTDELRASALGGLPDDAKTYRYGTRWLYRAIPGDVLDLIRAGFVTDDNGEQETATDEEPDILARLGLSIAATFVPFSQSRNASEKEPSLNWRVTVMHKGRAILITDYMKGCAHAPAYSNAKLRKSGGSRVHHEMVRYECETGKTVKAYGFAIDRPLIGASIPAPEAREVIGSLMHDASALDYSSFAEWAREYGCDDDSITDRATYDQCVAHALAIRGAIGSVAFDELKESAQ